MHAKRILITGGAGFIGSHLSDELLARGYRVRALDCLTKQVHGPGFARPSYLSDGVELIVGDVRDRDIVRRALIDVDAVFHLAAAVGVGQSMYELARYTATNNLGTAVLLEALIEKRVERLVVASSMSLYGEGLYRNRSGRIAKAVDRTLPQLQISAWEPRSADGEELAPVPTPEWKQPSLSSVYALSKFDQEQLCLMIGRAYGIPTVALRFFNVFGPRQALSNPYTGVLAIFAARLLNKNRPLVFEDGRQMRDFVNVRDVARACRLALEAEDVAGVALNVGSGRACTVLEVARALGAALGEQGIEPEITGKYRMGDVRHCFADISLARRVLGYQPQVSFENGLRELCAWLEGQVADDRVAQMRAELEARGLTA
jgi:dTDP-L-rhamnose 4-epimerase